MVAFAKSWRRESPCRHWRGRTARNMPPVISTIVMLRLFARRQRASMSAYFTNSLTPPTGLGLLTSLRGGFSHRSGSAWPGRSQKDGLPSARGESIVSGSRPSTRAQEEGAAWSLPLSNRGAGMDAKTRDVALLVALSLFCAGVALISDHLVWGLVFFVLGGVAAIEIALDQ